MTDFLQTPDKLSSKKRKQINKSKQKASIGETSLKKATINSLDNSNKKELSVFLAAIKILELKAQNIDIIMIGGDTYCTACFLKEAQVFAVSMRDIQYQAEKEDRAETNLKSVVLQEYHNFLDFFLKKNSDILPPYQKYNHKIYLEKEQKSGYAPLYNMFFEKLDAINWYLDSYLVKKFI